jgi:protein ATS1
MAVFSFGSNGNYQLGVGHDEDIDVPERVLIDEQVKSICSGGNHTVFISNSGQLYGTGLNSSGQLGFLGDEKHIATPTKHGDDKESFGLVGAGWEYTIAVTEDGKQLYSCGAGPKGELGLGQGVTQTREPKLIPNFPPEDRTVISLSTGMSHVIALLDDGSAYGWGAARKGQLGESAEKMVWSPRKVICDITNISHIGCGRDFSVLGSLSENTVIVLGDDRFGIRSNRPTDNQRSIKDLNCGWSHAQLLYSDGTVSSWGNNNHGQKAPKDLRPIKQMAVGTEHVLAIDNSNKLIAWGWGEHGNCGHNHVDGSITTILNDASSVKFIHSGYANSWYITH